MNISFTFCSTIGLFFVQSPCCGPIPNEASLTDGVVNLNCPACLVWQRLVSFMGDLALDRRLILSSRAGVE